MGARPLYSDSDADNSYNSFFRFGCENYKVVPTLKGIKIFDLKVWAVLILIILLLWGIIKFGKK